MVEEFVNLSVDELSGGRFLLCLFFFVHVAKKK